MSVASIANYLIHRYDYKSYLEIGIHRGKTFKQVGQADSPDRGGASPETQGEPGYPLLPLDLKVGIDPAGRKRGGIRPTYALTSDEFFSQNKDNFDIIFIDGLHYEEQFLRDVENSLASLNEGGTILCHDVNPKRWRQQQVPKSSYTRGGWLGTVWKGWVKLRASREDLWMHTIEGGVGLGVIRRGKQELIPMCRELVQPTWDDLMENRKEWMNLVNWEEFKNIL